MEKRKFDHFNEKKERGKIGNTKYSGRYKNKHICNYNKCEWAKRIYYETETIKSCLLCFQFLREWCNIILLKCFFYYTITMSQQVYL